VVYSRHRFVSRSPIQFDEFALDCERYELLRAGRPIKLEKIPMELLILLVNRDGRLVTRQEIVEQLWGKDVFVDTEHGINTAIRKVRQVLRDNPDRPRFVQTVAGKGYRFVARIEFPIASTASTDLQCLKRGTESREAPAAIESKAQAVWSYMRWFALLGVLATLVVGLAFWFLGRLPEPRVLASHL
jgi:DNA-binding winged helix-turn-helix (wHTH) protein